MSVNRRAAHRRDGRGFSCGNTEQPAGTCTWSVVSPAKVRCTSRKLSLTAEAQAERETGQDVGEWWAALDGQVRALLRSGRFPQLAAVHGRQLDDLDAVLEHALARYLDGLELRLRRAGATTSGAPASR